MRYDFCFLVLFVLISTAYSGCISEREVLEDDTTCEGELVEILNSAYTPSELTLSSSADCKLLKVTNNDGFRHTFTADDGTFDISLNAGETKSIDFSTIAAGTYTYHCKLHPSMTGTIILD